MKRPGGKRYAWAGRLFLVLLLCLAASVRLAQAAMPPAQAKRAAELDVMRKLRHVVQAADPTWMAGLRGWDLRSLTHPCSWERVKCDAQQRIIQINLWNDVRPMHSLPPAPVLLPELVQLEHLQTLRMDRSGLPLSMGLPSEWFRFGSFPRLANLFLRFAAAEGPIPEIEPGALPQLRTIDVQIPGLCSPLPGSWCLLPALHSLLLQIHVTGGLPVEWAAGFQQLETLIISSTAASDCVVFAPTLTGSSTVAASNGSRQVPALHTQAPQEESSKCLPAEWASGFPSLTHLRLSNFNFSCPYPPEWLAAFLHLKILSLYNTYLQGRLPVELFTRPNLTEVFLQHNHFTGTLPAVWSGSQVKILYLDSNQLTGPAFPPAWLQLGALPRLELYQVSSNTQLTGILPPTLPWPSIREIDVFHTAVEPTIPESWCHAPFAASLEFLRIGRNGVEPQLSSCASSSFADLIVNGKRLGSVTSPAASAAHSQPALAASLSVLAVGAVVAGAMTAMLHCHRRPQQAFTCDASEEQLLTAPPHSSHGEQSSLGSTQQAPFVGIAAPLQRAQVAALLRRALNDTCSIRLMAHRLHGPATRCGFAKPNEASPTADAVPHAVCQLLPSSSAGNAMALASWRNNSIVSGKVTGCSFHHSSNPLPKDSLRMQPDELEFLIDNEGLLIELGSGSQASVYLATLQGRKVAVKVYLLEESSAFSPAWAEAKIMRQCIHPRIVQLYGMAVEGRVLMLVMDFMEGGNLEAAIHRPATQEKLRWHAGGRQVALDVAEGLDYLHTELHMMHGDVKASNVLLSADHRACLADLGLAQVLGSRAARTAAGCTPVTAAPEQLMGERCTLAADMYSLGVLLVELITQEPAKLRSELRLPKAPHECPQSVVQLILGCLSEDPALRPTAAEALQCLRACCQSIVVEQLTEQTYVV